MIPTALSYRMRLGCQVAFLLILSLSAAAQDSSNVRNIFNTNNGKCFAVEAATLNGHSYAVIGSGFNLLMINIDDCTHPRVTGSVTLKPASIYAIKVVDTLAYVAQDTFGLRIINVANPAVPTEIGSYLTHAHAVDVEDGYAYVNNDVDVPSKFTIINVTDPTAPTFISTFTRTRPNGAPIKTLARYPYAYFTSADSLLILDITDRSNPFRVGAYPDGVDIAVRDTLAFITSSQSYGIRILNIVDKSAPFLVGAASAPSYCWYLTTGDTMLYACDFQGFHIFSVADPLHPQQIGHFDFSRSPPGGIDLSGTHILLADQQYGLRIVDVAVPSTPIASSKYLTIGLLYGLTQDSSWIYALENPMGDQADGSGVRIWQIADSGKLCEVGQHCDPSRSVNAIASVWPYVYAVGDSLKIIDVSDLGAPLTVGSCALGQHAYYLTFFQNYIYANSDSGLVIVNVITPSNPYVVGNYPMPWTGRGVVVFGNYAYCCRDISNLYVIDVSNPANPLFCSKYEPANAKEIAIDDTVAYVVCEDSMKVLNISNPATLVPVGAAAAYLSWYLCKNGKFIYTGNEQNGVRFIDVSNPSDPIERGYYKKDTNPPIYFFNIVSKDSYVYAMTLDSRIMAFQGFGPAGCEVPVIEDSGRETSHARLRASGCRIEFVIENSGPLSLDVYNVLGQHIRTIAEGFYLAGKHTIVWNGASQSGHHIANGIYIVRMRAGNEIWNASTLMLR